MFRVANDLLNIEENGPGLQQQVELLEEVCRLANEANKTGNVFASEILEVCYELIKGRIARPENKNMMSNEQVLFVMRVILINSLDNSTGSIRDVIEQIKEEFEI